MLWQHLSSPEVEATDKSRVVIVPLGSCEQHGRHLPLTVDTIQVTEIAAAIEQSLGDQVLLLPTLWLGSSHHHLGFPGTVSVSPDTYALVVRDVARSILQSGFRRIFFLNGHGGNEAPANHALTSLAIEDPDADSAHIVFGSWWTIGKLVLDPARHGMKSEALNHACEYETSLMLWLRPALVHQERIGPGETHAARTTLHAAGSNNARVYHRFKTLTECGHIGLPEAATSAKGESLFKALVSQLTGFVREMASWPSLATQNESRDAKGGQ